MNIPPLFLASLCLLGVSLLLFLVGFGSNYWFVVPNNFHYGLWAICYYAQPYCFTISQLLGGTPGHVVFARLCGFLQLIGVVTSVVMLLLITFKEARLLWIRVAFSTAICAGIIGFFGAIVFIAKETSDATSLLSVSWSGILVILAAFMQMAAGVCTFLPIRRGTVEIQQT